MELLGTGLGDHADLAGRGAAVLGRVVGGEDLDFLDGIHIGGADGGAVGAGTNTDGAVKGDERILRPAAVDGEAAMETP